MRLRAKILTTACGVALVAGALAGSGSARPALAGQPSTSDDAPPALVSGLAHDLHLSTDQARDLLLDQAEAQRVAKRLPHSLEHQLAGKWFDAATGKLTVAVTNQAAATAARAAGAEAKLVARGQSELDKLVGEVRRLAGTGTPGLRSFGVDPIGNEVVVAVNGTRKTVATERFLASVRSLNGVRVVEVDTSFTQQAGEVNPGDPWWPGGESNCSVGFGATDASGGKHFVTAGHCTNDANQAAYGQSGQQNRIGTSNVGGNRSVNAREGDMGVVAVTEAGWTISPSVNTWGNPAITVSGSKEAMVGEAVCHSGNTSPQWECGKVVKVNQAIDYGGGLIIEGLSTTSACSEGGDSGGAWLANDKAVGLHSGGESFCNPGDTNENSVFQPVNEALTKWGLTLLVGGNDTQPPSAPGNPRATGTTASTVSLAWDAATDNVGVTGYDVYNGTSLATTVTGTSATVSGLAADTTYTFTVKAKDAAGNVSPASAPVTARTQPGAGEDDEPPTTPGNPRSTGVTASTVSLAWEASVDNVGVTGYDVYNGSTLATSVAATSATVSGLSPNTSYSFTVQAKDAAGNKSKPTLPVTVRTSGDNGGRTFRNDTDSPIRDFQVTISQVSSTATGAAVNPITVTMTATHTCKQDLNISLVSPSGRWYTLQRYGGYPCTPFPGTKTFTVTPASGEAAAGTWTLRIGDNGPDDVGTLDWWSVTV